MGRLSAPDHPRPASDRRFCNVAIPHTRLHELTYEFERGAFPGLGPGGCVQVRLRGKKVKALVLEVLTRSPVPKTLSVEKVVEPELVPGQLLQLLRWVGAYYFGRMGEVLGLALPRGICGYGLRRARNAPAVAIGLAPFAARPAVSDLDRLPLDFPPAFAVHVENGTASREDVVTGFVAAGLERGTVVVLMPESETGAWVDRLRSRIGVEPVQYHGDQKLSNRKRMWRELRSARHALVVGVRSAVFAPVSDLAGVVVLDEHDSVFKEERHPRFHARDVAIARARLADCPVLLSDPTHSAETWLNLRRGHYQAVESSDVAHRPAAAAASGPAPGILPDTLVVDMRKHRDDVLSPVLANELKEARAAGESAVLYINRRGLSRYVACRDCGSPLVCPDCAVSLVLFSGGDLCCNYCGKAADAPDACPVCGSHDFRLKAPGIEMAAREVVRLLPDVSVTTVLTESGRQSPTEPGSVIIGTRALLGVPWPPRTRVVAALAVDADLCLPDFRARERTFQVLSALSRRAAGQEATLVLQTRRPEDPAVQNAAAGDTIRFLDQELRQREELEFPPYCRLALVELGARSSAGAMQRGEWLCRRLARVEGVEALGPVPARGRANTVQVMVKVPRHVRFDRFVALSQLEADGVKAKVDVDPLETV